MAMPLQKPGKSRQDYQTPPEFLAAVKKRLGIKEFYLDLAASKENAVTKHFYTEADNSLEQDWANPDYMTISSSLQWAFCNPPYSNIEPWVKKAYLSRSNVAMLVPASVGSNWWRDWVHTKCVVLLLNGRLTFVGAKDPYPKDCALLLYCEYIANNEGRYEIFEWRSE